jgi:hypothetical protein
VREEADQVVIVIRAGVPGEHISLHRDPKKGVMLTHYAPGIAHPPMPDRLLEIARSIYRRDPDRHVHYAQHRPLFPEPIEGADGHLLLGRLITLADAPAKAKYERREHIAIEAPAATFMLNAILSTPGQPYSRAHEPHVSTSFSALYFVPMTAE